MECPECHSTDVKKRGIAHLAGGDKQRCRCSACMHVFSVEIIKEPAKLVVVKPPVKIAEPVLMIKRKNLPGSDPYERSFQYPIDIAWVLGHGEPATKEELAGAIERLGKQRVEELRAEAEAEERRMPPIGAFFGGMLGGHQG